MECEEARFGVYALLDNELDIAKSLEVLGHLEGCPACQRELELDMRLKAVVREHLSVHAPPPGLWSTIVQRIEREAESPTHPWPMFSRVWRKARLLPALVAFLAVAVMFGLSLVFIHPREAPSLLADALVRDHLHAITKASGPVEVRATDPAAIIEHFRTKLPSSTPVPFLVHEGARLVGGSFCQLGQAKGVRFTYEVGIGRTVSLYQMERPARASVPHLGTGPLYVGPPQGPGLVLWGNARFLYALVGELPPADLQGLASHVGGT